MMALYRRSKIHILVVCFSSAKNMKRRSIRPLSWTSRGLKIESGHRSRLSFESKLRLLQYNRSRGHYCVTVSKFYRSEKFGNSNRNLNINYLCHLSNLRKTYLIFVFYVLSDNKVSHAIFFSEKLSVLEHQLILAYSWNIRNT